jgi:hypothetical protein
MCAFRRIHENLTGFMRGPLAESAPFQKKDKETEGRMRMTVNGGLVEVAGKASVEVELSRKVDDRLAQEGRRKDVTEGWDPYDVWRKRVKEPRESKMALKASGMLE